MPLSMREVVPDLLVRGHSITPIDWGSPVWDGLNSTEINAAITAITGTNSFELLLVKCRAIVAALRRF